MKPAGTSQEQENIILRNLLRETMAGSLRWGFQPPSTIQANKGKLHYVIRLRQKGRAIYKLTARRDGSRTVDFVIERAEAEADHLAELYRFATKGRT
ncbi:MAG TPA: hypothetical protein VFD58_25375 [Blastocatellia bacterium]|nr:hypothetical protein [Blastocatellia bacterium]